MARWRHKGKVHITDHAVERYAERVLKVPLDNPGRVRHVMLNELGEQLSVAVALGARALRIGKTTYCLKGSALVTVIVGSTVETRGRHLMRSLRQRVTR